MLKIPNPTLIPNSPKAGKVQIVQKVVKAAIKVPIPEILKVRLLPTLFCISIRLVIMNIPSKSEKAPTYTNPPTVKYPPEVQEFSAKAGKCDMI